MKAISISSAKRISEESGYPAIVVFGIDPETGKQHVTTYGKTKKHCSWCAELGNKLKKALGWPDSECHASPNLTKKDS
jgi:hypothetical protein